MQDERGYLIFMVIFILLVGFEAFLSFGCSALENVNEGTVKRKAEEGEGKAEKIWKLIELTGQYKNMVFTIFTGIHIFYGILAVNIVPVSFSMAAECFLENQLPYWGFFGYQVLFVVVIIYLVVLFGNILPEKIALRNPEKSVYSAVSLLHIVFKCFIPFNWILRSSANGILFLLGINSKELQENVTEEEIKSIVNEGREQGVLEESEVEMISNIIDMDDKEVKDIMIHRQKIVAIDSDTSIEKALKDIMEEGYSRYPVYEENIDNIIGILYVKDVIQYYISEKDNNQTVKLLIKKPYFVPDTQRIDSLFRDMQFNKIHMAAAIDEYGQTAGIVAMEDILEEIVGNIMDEYDEDEKLIIKQTSNRYLMKGMAPLEEVAETLKINMEEELENYDTLNGLLISLIGHIPEETERSAITYRGYQFHIIDVKNKMIHYVRVIKEEIGQ